MPPITLMRTKYYQECGDWKDKMIEQIKGKDGQLVAIVLRGYFDKEGVNFFTPPESSLQLGALKHKKGTKIKPHIHKKVERTLNYTQEILHLEYGRVEAKFYQDGKVVRNCLLSAGDTIILLKGGHGFNVLEDTKMIEVKQGPYLSPAEDKELLEIEEEYQDEKNY